MIPSKVYDVLKWICLICLPATATFYFAVASIWGLPYAKEVGETITAIGTFLGCLIGVSTIKYNEFKEEELKRIKELNGQNDVQQNDNTVQQDGTNE